MGPFMESLASTVGSSLAGIIWALVILLVGWIVALLISAGVGSLLKRTSLDNTLVEKAGLKQGLNIEGIISRLIFWIIMIFVIVAALTALNLTVVTDPLNSMLNEVFAALPNVLFAVIIAFVAWLIATFLRFVVTKLLGATNIDDRLASSAGLTEEEQVPMSETLANIVYWFVLLLFLPAILGALNLQGLLGPMTLMVNDLLGYVPNVFAAAIILVLGYFIARIIRQIVTGLLVALGADSLGERVGLAASGGQRLSNLIGTVVYVLVLIPVLVSALDALDIAAISQPAVNMLNSLLEAVPNIFGAMIILGVAYFIARLVSNLVTTLLTSVGFNQVLGLIGIKQAEGAGRTPAELVGYLVLFGIMLFATIEAAGLLGFTAVAVLLSEFLTFASQVVLAIVVFGIGLYLANLAGSIIMSTAGAYANILSQVARGAIIILSAAMALRQMGIADDIINLAFGLSLGAIALAAALAFGLGGRETAARELEGMVKSLRSDNK